MGKQFFQRTLGMRTEEGEAVRLHLGCGGRYLKGYINIDLPPAQHTVQATTTADQYADLTTLSYPEGSVNEIRLHHVFEHFDRQTAVRLLMSWYRWLKPVGKLIIETPDFENSLKSFAASPDIDARSKTLRHLFGSHEAEWALHKDGWYRDKFERYLEAIGFEELSFQYSEWQSLSNITVTATKGASNRTLNELLVAAEDLLRLSMVDESESEKRMLDVWMDDIRKHFR